MKYVNVGVTQQLFMLIREHPSSWVGADVILHDSSNKVVEDFCFRTESVSLNHYDWLHTAREDI
jgi:hypothetical protein